MQFALRSVDTAFGNFNRGNAGYPRFKSKKGKNSFTAPQHTRLSGEKVFVPKFNEGISCNVHRKVKGDIGKMTFSRTPAGKHFVSLLTREHYQPKEKTGAVAGIDLGITHFAVTSEGERFENNRYVKKNERALAKAQKHLSRKRKGSNSSEKQRWKVARVHEKIANTRADQLHKISRQLVDQYDVIAVEDLGPNLSALPWVGSLYV